MMNWSREELKIALALYCQLPFGKLHSGNPEVASLAGKLGRTPSAVAMKLVNFASLDPAITRTGRRGLGNASKLDREVWEAFANDWERELTSASKKLKAPNIDLSTQWTAPEEDVETEKEAQVVIRTKQQLFRRMILAGYSARCCMSGLSIEKCLVASHITRWKDDKAARLNPHNGLCLSALHDKAFEHGYISVTPEYEIKVSGAVRTLVGCDSASSWLTELNGKQITLPEKFLPGREFLETHLRDRYLGD